MQLFEYLVDHDIYQKTFAEKIGVSQPTLSRYLVGETIPSVVTAIKIEQATGGAVKPRDWLTVVEDFDNWHAGAVIDG